MAYPERRTARSPCNRSIVWSDANQFHATVADSSIEVGNNVAASQFFQATSGYPLPRLKRYGPDHFVLWRQTADIPVREKYDVCAQTGAVNNLSVEPMA